MFVNLLTHCFFFPFSDEDTDEENEEDEEDEEDMETERVEEEIVFMDVGDMEQIQDLF